jgi:hypothetical protein
MGNAGSNNIWVQYVTGAVFTLRRRNAVQIATNPVASGKESNNKTTQYSTEHRHRVLELVFRIRKVLSSNLDLWKGYAAFHAKFRQQPTSN